MYGPVTIALPRLVSFLILIVVAIALFAFLKYSTTGKQIRAVSQNPIGAEVVGINVKKIYILTYGLGVALAGIAGSLLTQFYTIYPTAGASFGFRALIVVAFGKGPPSPPRTPPFPRENFDWRGGRAEGVLFGGKAKRMQDIRHTLSVGRLPCRAGR